MAVATPQPWYVQLYAQSPCCSAPRKQWSPAHRLVQICSRCDGLYGGPLYEHEVQRLIGNGWAKGNPPVQRWRYFDFAVYGTVAIRRTHGWFDRVRKGWTQLG